MVHPVPVPEGSVHDVFAHLFDSATTTRVGSVRQMLSARFDFDKANTNGVERHRAGDRCRPWQRFVW